MFRQAIGCKAFHGHTAGSCANDELFGSDDARRFAAASSAGVAPLASATTSETLPLADV